MSFQPAKELIHKQTEFQNLMVIDARASWKSFGATFQAGCPETPPPRKSMCQKVLLANAAPNVYSDFSAGFRVDTKGYIGRYACKVSATMALGTTSVCREPGINVRSAVNDAEWKNFQKAPRCCCWTLASHNVTPFRRRPKPNTAARFHFQLSLAVFSGVV